MELVGCCAGRAVLDPVVGNALRAVGYRDRAALAESEGRKRASHRCVVLVGVAAQVIRALGCKAENRPGNASPAHRGDAVNHVVVGIGTPSSLDIGVGLVWPGCKGKHCERSLVVGHKEAVPARDVLFCVNPAGVPVGPLSRIPIRLHERPSMRICTLNEREVVRGGDSNLHMGILTLGIYSVAIRHATSILESDSN